MKTLDEVIELSERCTLPYPGDCLNCEFFEDETGYDCRCKIIADALYYLKEYRSKQDTIAEQLAELKQKNDHVCELAKTVCEEYDRLCNRLAEEYRNDALSWDELKQMEGKPVWVEESADNGLWWTYWVIWEDEKNAALPEKTYGTAWQAYRKERK